MRYCEKTGTQSKLRHQYEVLWQRLLQDYDWNGPALAADLQLVIRYLRKQIDADKRNPGALKLANLLQPDQFEADVNEARIVLPQKKKVFASENTENTENTESTEKKLTPEEEAQLLAEAKVAFRKFKEGMK